MIDKPSIRWDAPQPTPPEVDREDSFLHQADPKYVADYKIQVMFAKGRTTNGPNACGIQIWESGRKLHGGGDTLSRWCAEKDAFDNVLAGPLHELLFAFFRGHFREDLFVLRAKFLGFVENQLVVDLFTVDV